MIKLTRVLDAYFGDYTDYYTCEKNIASMTVVNDRTRFGYCQVTKITTFDGKTVGVTETPDEIFRKFEQDKKKS